MKVMSKEVEFPGMEYKEDMGDSSSKAILLLEGKICRMVCSCSSTLKDDVGIHNGEDDSSVLPFPPSRWAKL